MLLGPLGKWPLSLFFVFWDKEPKTEISLALSLQFMRIFTSGKSDNIPGTQGCVVREGRASPFPVITCSLHLVSESLCNDRGRISNQATAQPPLSSCSPAKTGWSKCGIALPMWLPTLWMVAQGSDNRRDWALAATALVTDMCLLLYRKSEGSSSSSSSKSSACTMIAEALWLLGSLQNILQHCTHNKCLTSQSLHCTWLLETGGDVVDFDRSQVFQLPFFPSALSHLTTYQKSFQCLKWKGDKGNSLQKSYTVTSVSPEMIKNYF